MEVSIANSARIATIVAIRGKISKLQDQEMELVGHLQEDGIHLENVANREAVLVQGENASLRTENDNLKVRIISLEFVRKEHETLERERREENDQLRKDLVYQTKRCMACAAVLTDEEKSLLPTKKLEVIKMVRERTGVGLKEAHDIVAPPCLKGGCQERTGYGADPFCEKHR